MVAIQNEHGKKTQKIEYKNQRKKKNIHRRNDAFGEEAIKTAIVLDFPLKFVG